MYFRFLSQFLSYLLHPLFIPTYSLVLIFNYYGYLSFRIPVFLKKVLFVIVVFNTVIMPVIISLALKKKGVVKSLEMESPEERRLPYLSGAVLYFFTYYLIRMFGLPVFLTNSILGAAIGIILCAIINMITKISAHMIGIGGLTGLVLAMSQKLIIDMEGLLILTFLLSGLLASARMYLEAHTPFQIYTGFCLGFICEFVLLTI